MKEYDYENLDKLLKYFSEKDDYRNWNNYINYLKELKVFVTSKVINDYKVGCNILAGMELLKVKDERHPIQQREFAISPKGYDLIVYNVSVKQYHREILAKEKLEHEILQGTVDSHRLNYIQLAVTIILGLGTFFAIYYQIEGNKINEKMYQLELDKFNAEKKAKSNIIDTVVVRFDSINNLRK